MRVSIVLGIIVVGLFPTAEQLSSQTIRGRVIQSRGGAPLADARVLVSWAGGDSIGSIVTDSLGKFSVRTIRPGKVVLQVERPGSATVITNPIDLSVGDIKYVEVPVPLSPIQLDPIHVEAVRGPLVTGTLLDGFHERRYWLGEKLGLGSFITRDHIEQRNPAQLTDLLRMIPSLRFTPTRPPRYRVEVGAAPMCDRSAHIYVDGIRWNRSSVDDDIDLAVHPSLLEGVEVYRGGSQIPAEYGGSDARCGVILLWTRRGR